MADVDAVIAALQVVLEEAEARGSEFWWKTHIVNKWIDQLPGARRRWRELRLRGDSGDLAQRANLITHVRATLAYLETNRDAIAAQRSWWPFGRAALRSAPKEKLAQLEKRREAPTVDDGTTKPKWLN